LRGGRGKKKITPGQVGVNAGAEDAEVRREEEEGEKRDGNTEITEGTEKRKEERERSE
jgi:hypothetical protein